MTLGRLYRDMVDKVSDTMADLLHRTHEIMIDEAARDAIEGADEWRKPIARRTLGPGDIA